MPFKDKATRLAYERIRRKNLRDAAVEKLGGKCVTCERKEDLEFDHIRPEEKLYSISQVWHRRKEIRDAEIAKCQLLCLECHMKKDGRCIREPGDELEEPRSSIRKDRRQENQHDDEVPF